MTQALQTIERRVNELGVAEPIVARHGDRRPDPGAAARRDRRAARQGHHPLHGAARAEARRAGPVPEPRKRRCRRSTTACRRTWMIVPGAPTAPRPAAARRRRVYYVVRRVPAVTGRDLRNARPTLDENNLPAVSFSLNQDGARQVRRRSPQAEHRPPARHHPRQPRVLGADDRRARIADEGRITGSFTPQEAQDLSLIAAVGRAAGVADLPRGAHDRADRSAPTRSAPASPPSLGGLVAGRAVHAVLLQADRPQRRHLDRGQPAHPARHDGLPRRHDDAAGHRRLHPDDRHGRRLERADLRAHQGGAGDGQAASARPSTPASTASGGRSSTRTSSSLIAAAFLFQFGTGPIRGFATTLIIGLLVERVHRGLRVAHDVRAGAVAPPRRRRR